MSTLILERFCWLDSGTDNVAISDLETRLAIVQRLLLQSTYSLFKHPDLLNPVEIVENDTLVTPDDDDLASLVGICPAHVNVTNNVSWITEGNKSHIVTAISQYLAAHCAYPLRHTVEQVVEDGNVVRGQIPERVHIAADGTEICPPGVEVIDPALARLDVLFYLLNAGIEYECVTDH